MAIPFFIPLLFAAASAGANALASNQANNAREDVSRAERIRQRMLDQEAQALNVKSQNRYQDFGGKQDVRAKKLGDYFVKETGTSAGDPNVVAASVLPSSASSLVQEEQARQDAAVDAWGNQQGRALGDLRAFGDLLGETSNLQGRDAGLVSQIGGFKRGSASALPLELYEASRKGAGFKFLADALGLAGTVTSGMGGVPGMGAGASMGADAAAGASAFGLPVAKRSPFSFADLFKRTRFLG